MSHFVIESWLLLHNIIWWDDGIDFDGIVENMVGGPVEVCNTADASVFTFAGDSNGKILWKWVGKMVDFLQILVT